MTRINQSDPQYMATKVATTYNRTGISSYLDVKNSPYPYSAVTTKISKYNPSENVTKGHVSVARIRVHSLIDAELKANCPPPNRHLPKHVRSLGAPDSVRRVNNTAYPSQRASYILISFGLARCENVATFSPHKFYFILKHF